MSRPVTIKSKPQTLYPIYVFVLFIRNVLWWITLQILHQKSWADIQSLWDHMIAQNKYKDSKVNLVLTEAINEKWKYLLLY